MSRFDDELRRAVAPLAGEPLPEGLLDEALDGQPAVSRRPLAVAGVTLVVVAALAVGVGIGQLTPDPSPDPTGTVASSPSPAASPQAVRHEVVVDGIRMTAELDSDRGMDGVPVHLTVTVENVGTESVHWSQSGCQWSTHVGVEPVPRFEFGRDWGEADASELKRNVLSVWGLDDFTPYNFGNADGEPRPSTGCFTSGSGRRELAPGASVTDELAWLPEGPLGMPLRTGTYEVTAVFPLIPATGEAHDRDPSDNVSMSFPIEIEGPAINYLMPGEAIDVILDDDRLWTMLEGVRTERWIVPRLEYEGERWLMWLPVGKPSAWVDFSFGIVAEVDAVTGELLELRRTDVTPDDPSVPPQEGAFHQHEADGIQLNIEVDRAATVANQPIFVEATVGNIGSESVFWVHSSTCVYPIHMQLDPHDEHAYDPGRDWEGEDGILKSITINEDWLADPAYRFIPRSWLGLANVGCTSDGVTTELAPGDSITTDLAWEAAGLYGLPPQPGTYTVTAGFTYASRGTPPDPDGPYDGFEVTMQFEIEVVGSDPAVISPGVAFDAVLADGDYREMLASTPRSRWLQSDMRFVDGHWEAALYITRSAIEVEPVQAIVAIVDATTGDVLAVRIEERTPPP